MIQAIHMVGNWDAEEFALTTFEIAQKFEADGLAVEIQYSASRGKSGCWYSAMLLARKQ